MTQQEWDDAVKIENVWRYLGNQMVANFGKNDFAWYQDAWDFYDRIFQANPQRGI